MGHETVRPFEKNKPELPDALKKLFSVPDVLLPYQKRVLETTAAHRVTVIEKSRRIGVTWALGADAVLTSATARAEGGMDTLYIGYNLDMAREFIDTCAMWATAFHMAAAEVEETVFFDQADKKDKVGNREIKAFRITFASGYEIMALTSKPRSLRGRQGYVIFDEAAFHDDLAGMMKAAMAFLVWGGKVLVVSTHDGDTNAFNTLVQDIRAKRKPYKILRIDIDDAINDGLVERVRMAIEAKGQKLINANGEPITTREAWREDLVEFYGDDADEELFCIPSEGSGTYLSGSLVEARMDASSPVVRWERPKEFAELPDHIREAECLDFCERELKHLLEQLDPTLKHVIGGDFGRSGDLSVFMPFAIEQNLTRRAPFTAELRNIPFQQQEQIFKYICDRLPRFSAGALDARGNGQYLAERAMQRYGAARIFQVMPTVEWYRENMPPYKAAFEDATIILSKDADILGDHRALVMDKGVARIPENARTKDKKGGQRHGDSAIAGALGHFASRQDTMEYDYIPAHQDDRDAPRDGMVGRVHFKSKGAW